MERRKIRQHHWRRGSLCRTWRRRPRRISCRQISAPRKIAAISTVAYGMLLTGFGVAETIWAQDFITVPYLVTESLLQGCFATSVIAICLGVSHPAIAATQFTAYMAMSNLATSWGTGISPWVQNNLWNLGCVCGSRRVAGITGRSAALHPEPTLAGTGMMPRLLAHLSRSSTPKRSNSLSVSWALSRS